MIKYFNLLALLSLLLFSCDKETSDTDTMDPSNLNVSVDVATDGSGEVTVTASAENTVNYQFFMGDGNPNEPFQNTTGVYQHTYETLGTYKIEVRAYGASGRFVKKETQLAVQSGEPASAGPGYTTPTQYNGMELVWNDEFEGNVLSPDNWMHEIGNGNNGWGNQELQYYRSQNTTVGGGVLTIEAREEAFEGRAYTSSRIISQGKQYFQYGRVDLRAKLPKGKGLWPALWMLGQNFSSVGWPSCGEIDIMELVGGSGTNDATVHGTVHWSNEGNHAFVGDSYKLNSGNFSDEFHVFSIIWTPNNIQWLVDDNPYFSMDITSSEMTEFEEAFFFIFNVAVGGVWPGSPNETTVFPQQMLVDYVRVFQNN